MQSCELLTLDRMARRLGVTQRWLREQAEAGTIPHIKAGDRYLFSVTAVENTLADQAGRGSENG